MHKQYISQETHSWDIERWPYWRFDICTPNGIGRVTITIHCSKYADFKDLGSLSRNHVLRWPVKPAQPCKEFADDSVSIIKAGHEQPMNWHSNVLPAHNRWSPCRDTRADFKRQIWVYESASEIAAICSVSIYHHKSLHYSKIEKAWLRRVPRAICDSEVRFRVHIKAYYR
jgi:hypothetical protein